MWSVWRVNGRDPYRIYHDLDDDYVPMGGGDPMPPPYPSRLQAVLFAFGDHEFKFRARLAGAKFEGVDEKAREKQKALRARRKEG